MLPYNPTQHHDGGQQAPQLHEEHPTESSRLAAHMPSTSLNGEVTNDCYGSIAESTDHKDNDDDNDDDDDDDDHGYSSDTSSNNNNNDNKTSDTTNDVELGNRQSSNKPDGVPPAISDPKEATTSLMSNSSNTHTSEKRSSDELWENIRTKVQDESFQIHCVDQEDQYQRREMWKTNFDEIEIPYQFTMMECFVALLIYLLLGVFAYSVILERWRVVDSLYFTVVTFTTVGYGDISPTTQIGRLFTAIFALAGIAFLGIVLGVVGSNVVEAQIKTLAAAEEETANMVLSIFHGGREDETGDAKSDGKNESKNLSRQGSTSSLLNVEETKETESPLNEDPEDVKRTDMQEWCSLVWRVIKGYAPALTPFLVGSFIIGKGEGWTLNDVIYYCVITSATIGYGDLTPDRDSMKWFAVVFIPLAVAAVGDLLGKFANCIIEQRREAYQTKLWAHDLKVEDLEAMDCDGDGKVSRLEYIEFMLLTMNKVDTELLDKLNEQFDELDVTKTGSLDKRDLQIIAKKRLRTVRKKLELGAYKRKLMQETQQQTQCKA